VSAEGRWASEVESSLVSIVIPVFNGERFLPEAIESVLAQDHRPIEVIVVDDGSTDASVDVARSFDDVVVLGSANRGAAAARNLGVARAVGPFLTFLDADDLMAPGRLRVQHEHLLSNPDTGCVLMHQEVLVEPSPDLRPPIHGGQVTVPPMTAFLRKTTFDAVGGFDPTYRIVHDTVWLFRLRDANVRIDILPEIGLIRRIHEANLSHRVDVIRSELARSLQDRVRRGRPDDWSPA
jgi:glycosyltransferase involved in cell wall biosynthesis